MGIDLHVRTIGGARTPSSLTYAGRIGSAIDIQQSRLRHCFSAGARRVVEHQTEGEFRLNDNPQIKVVVILSKTCDSTGSDSRRAQQ